MNHVERQAAWDPHGGAVKVRCPNSHRVLLWRYPDGTLEIPCNRCRPRPGYETRHVVFTTGESIPVFVPKPIDSEGPRLETAPCALATTGDSVERSTIPCL